MAHREDDIFLPVGPELFAMSDPEETNNDDPTPQDVLDALHQDLVGQRSTTSIVEGCWLVLVPQSSRGTPRFVQDAMSEVEEVVPGALLTHNDEEWRVGWSLAHNPRTIQGQSPVGTRLGNFQWKRRFHQCGHQLLRSGLEGGSWKKCLRFEGH